MTARQIGQKCCWIKEVIDKAETGHGVRLRRCGGSPIEIAYIRAVIAVNRHRRLTPRKGSARSLLSDTKWKFSGVTIGADKGPCRGAELSSRFRYLMAFGLRVSIQC
jgi:hypothetical protein